MDLLDALGSPSVEVSTEPGQAQFDSAVLVLREGLEAILVLAALTASVLRANRSYRGPVGAGAGLAFLASLATSA